MAALDKHARGGETNAIDAALGSKPKKLRLSVSLAPSAPCWCPSETDRALQESDATNGAELRLHQTPRSSLTVQAKVQAGS